MDYNQIIDAQIATFESVRENYKALNRAATPLMRPSAPILGRDMSELRLALRNPEKANVILLGDPGSGKTAFMQGFTYNEDSTQYLVVSVDVERLVKDSTGDKDSEMANGLQDLVMETSQYSKDHNVIMVLFIDEFHRIAMLSPSSVEALKPILEKSSYNGFRVVAATTFEEYDQWIASNRALDQRLLRMSLPELPREAVINILKSRAKQYNVLDYAEDGIFGEIYDISKQILISNSQPRASIDILNNVIGNITKTEYMKDGKLIREYATCKDMNLPGDKVLGRAVLQHVIRRSYGIDIDNKVPVKAVRDALSSRIYNQDQAVQTVMSRIEMMLAGFNDPTRPKISVLLTGPTGTGKMLTNDTLVPTPNGIVKHGDLKIGDYVFNQKGKPVKVLGTYKHNQIPIYKVTLDDGRELKAGGPHLWKVIDTSGSSHVCDTTIIANTLKHGGKLSIPVQGIAQYNKKDTVFDPYLIGFYCGRTERTKLSEEAYQRAKRGRLSAQLVEGFYEKGIKVTINGAIPDSYLHNSTETRIDVLRGFIDSSYFDIYSWGLRFSGLTPACAKSLASLIRSLGMTAGYYEDESDKVYLFASERTLRVFTTDKELSILFKQVITDKDIEAVLISKVEEIGIDDAQCIYVDDPEHLYLAGDYVVTHNTELTKVIAETLRVPLKRFDMSRYPRAEDAVAFADHLAQAGWSAPNGIILIDEIEKSSREAINNLLQVLDDARLTAPQNPNRVISFTGNIIIMTTNLGSEVYQHNKRYDKEGDWIDTELIYKALVDDPRFEQAVLGRVDAIVPFNGLPESAIEKIAKKELMTNLLMITTSKRQFFVSDDIIPYIVKDRTSADTERGGARDAKRNIKNIVIQKVASYLADEPDEVPCILFVAGQPRFKHKEVVDPLSGYIDMVECYPFDMVNQWLAQLSQKFGRKLEGKNLFVPNTWQPQDFVANIVRLVQAGHTTFTTHVDEEFISITPA